jgi:membrane associated rhomboid family serine protease
VASNLYFFVVFGASVEDRLGKLWFLALLVAAHLAGVSLHMAADPGGAEPIVGASAGISGVIACYAVAFPQAKLGFFFLVRFIAVRAIWALVLFIVLQMFGAMEQLKGYSQVSYLAHLGGLAVGVVAGLIWRMRSGR